MVVLWTTTAPRTTVSTRPNKLTETPEVSKAQEPHYLKQPTTTTTTYHRPRRIPDNVLEQPTQTTTTAPISTVEFDIREIVCSKSWECEEAMSGAYCESRLNPGAISPTNSNNTRDWGLMQINDVWRQAFPVSWPNVLDAQTNVDMAWHIYQTAGNTWQPWTCKP